MENKLKYILDILFILLVVGCFDDEGNYSYIKISDIELSGIEKDYRKSVSYTHLATIGTATDIDGNFTLRVPEDVTTLEVGFVGMKTQLVSIKDKTEVRVVMEEDNTVLEDVVVTGIFKKTKESYTGAVSTISKDEIMAFRGQNMLQTLRNIDPAFNVMENNEFGSDPNRLPDITVRGNSSLSSNLEEFNARCV